MQRPFLTLLLGLVMCANSSQAQNQRVVDSLHNVLKNQSGADRFLPLYDLTFEYVHKDNYKALEYIEQAAEAAVLSGDSLWILKAMRIRGVVLYALGRPQEALDVLQPFLRDPSPEKYSTEYFGITNVAAACYLLMSRFDKALDLYFLTYQEASKLRDSEFVSITLRNIGLVYYKLNDNEKALYYMKKGLQTKPAFDNANFGDYLNISLCYVNMGRLDSARAYLKEIVVACEDGCRDEEKKHAKYASGRIYYEEGRFHAAEHEFLESLNFATEQNDMRMCLDNIYSLAMMSINANQLDKAKSYLDKAESIMQEGTPFTLEEAKVYKELSHLYLSISNYKKAAYYQSRYIKLNDSVYHQNLATSLMEVESKYLQAQNEAKIAEQAHIIHLNREVIRRQRQLNILYTTVVVLTMVIIAFLFRTYCKKRMLTAFLRRKVQDRTRELELNRHALEERAREQELLLRRAFSGVSGGLATVKGLCLTALEEVADPVARGYVDRIDIASSKVDQFIRTVLNNRSSINNK